MIRKIFFLLSLLSLSFAGTFPYCSFENSSQIKTYEFVEFLNNETNKVTEELGDLLQSQKDLSKQLSAKIATLIEIKKVLSQIFLMKKEENFELEKQVKLLTY